MSDLRWAKGFPDTIWTKWSTFNPGPVEVTQGANGEHVTYLTCTIGSTGSVVIPVPNGVECMVIKPSQTVIAYQANSNLPSPETHVGTINETNITCTPDVQTRLYFSTTGAYDVVELRGSIGTVVNIEMADAEVILRGNVLAGSYPALDKTSLVSVLSGPYEAINLSNQYRVRQDGTVNQVEFFNGITTGVTEVTVGFWRLNSLGTLYNLVGRTENLISKLIGSSSDAQKITLDTPVQGIKAGDFISVRCVCHNSAAGPLYIHTTTGAKIWYTLPNVWSTDTNMDWDAGGSLTASANSAIPVRVYMEAPEYVFSGDITLSNAAFNGSYCQGNATLVADSPQSTIAYNTALKMGYKPFQNISIDAATMYSYFTWALAHGAYKAKTQIIQLGLNDVIAGTSPTDIETAMGFGISGLIGAGITPVFVLPIPWTAGTNDQQTAMTAMRTAIKNECITSDVLYIDPSATLGQARVSQGITRVERDLVNILFTNLSRTDDVATATCASPHGLQTGDEIIVKTVEFADGVDATFNSSQVSVTRIDATKFSYASTGTDKVETACVAGSLDHPIALITSVGHGLSSGMVIDVTGVTTADFDIVGAVVTKQSADTFTYSNFGIAVSDKADATGAFSSVDVMPSTNLYDLATAYNSGDGVTMTAAGNLALATLISAQLKEAGL